MTLRIAMAQINPTVGDLAANVRCIGEFTARAKRSGADLVVFPELAITGYPPEDLLHRPRFIEANLKAAADVAKAARGIVSVFGFADRDGDVFNAAAVCADGSIAGRYHKAYLPNYGVFDENRYFAVGQKPLAIELNGATIGVTICEDIWQPGGPMRDEVLGAGAQVVVNLSSSPFNAGKRELREKMLSTRASDHSVALVYCNLVGGQDELVFDGYSSAYDHQGRIIARAKGFAEDLVLVDVDPGHVFHRRLRDLRHRQEREFYEAEDRSPVERVVVRPPARKGPRKKAETNAVLSPEAEVADVYAALTLGTRDYLRKNGFSKAVVGLSGGVDSALVAAVAADALGPKNVWCVFMPTRYSSGESREDAKKLAENLGCRFDVIAVEDVFAAFAGALAPTFKRRKPDLTEENLQSRIRGTILMALSNKFGHLVLATGNKSESSVGYATLYGDMCGGLSVIKDVPKLRVYELCRYRNRTAGTDLVPERILTKAPTAELRANQKDSDSLPEYDELDPILRAYVEDDRAPAEIVAAGNSRETVNWVMRMVDLAEYKRRQSAPGIRITQRAFGKDRRLPITNRYRND